MAEAVQVPDDVEKPSVLIIGGLGKHCYFEPSVLLIRQCILIPNDYCTSLTDI